MNRLLTAWKSVVDAAQWLVGNCGRAFLWCVGTPRRALLTMVVVVVAVVALVSTPGFSAGVIVGLITALILD